MASKVPRDPNLTPEMRRFLDDLSRRVDGILSGQIPFPATQNASSDPNTLDDYEEGTWTPVLTAATPGDLSVAYTEQVGWYRKIGSQVILGYRIVTSSFTYTTASGLAQLTGVPFASANVTSQIGTGTTSYSGFTKAGYHSMTGLVPVNTSVVRWGLGGSGVAAALATITDFPTGGTVVLHGGVQYAAAN